jgi:hypothetical protein
MIHDQATRDALRDFLRSDRKRERRKEPQNHSGPTYATMLSAVRNYLGAEGKSYLVRKDGALRADGSRKFKVQLDNKGERFLVLELLVSAELKIDVIRDRRRKAIAAAIRARGQT